MTHPQAGQDKPSHLSDIAQSQGLRCPPEAIKVRLSIEFLTSAEVLMQNRLIPAEDSSCAFTCLGCGLRLRSCGKRVGILTQAAGVGSSARARPLPG
jgi:hypothetical protein